MQEAVNQAQYIADRFGGASSLAEAINVPYHQARDWCRRIGFIPEKHRLAVLHAAIAKDVNVTAYDFIRHLVVVRDEPSNG